MALDIMLEKDNCPKILFSFILYNNDGIINASGGIVNTLDESIQVRKYMLSQMHSFIKVVMFLKILQ